MKKTILTTLAVSAFLGTALAQTTTNTTAPHAPVPLKMNIKEMRADIKDARDDIKEVRGDVKMMRASSTNQDVIGQQVKALMQERDQKIKAIMDEYQAKIKALIGSNVNASSTTMMRGEDNERGRIPMMNASGTPILSPMMNASGTPTTMPPFRMNENQNMRNENQNIENSQPEGAFSKVQGFLRGLFGGNR